MDSKENQINSQAISLKDMIINGYQVSYNDMEVLKKCELDLLSELACEIRDNFSDGEFDLCTIINGKSGACSENCSFCAQSAHHNTHVDIYDILDTDQTRSANQQ